MILLSAFVAHTAWHWMTERWACWCGSRCSGRSSTWRSLAALLRWAMLAVLAVLAAWLVRPLVGATADARGARRAEL